MNISPLRIKVIIPEDKKNQITEQRIKRIITELKPKLGQILIGLTFCEPATMAELRASLLKNMALEISRSALHKYVQDLVNFNLISEIDAQEAITNAEKSLIYKEIKRKHFKYIEKFDGNFKKRFRMQKYYFISDKGTGFISFVCNKFGYGVEQNG